MPNDIPMGYLQSMTNAINAVTGVSVEAVKRELDALTSGGTDPRDLVPEVLKMLEPYLQDVTGSTASLSAQIYDFIRMAQTGEAFGAEPYASRDPEWTQKAVEGMAKNAKSAQGFVKGVLDRVDYEAKRAAGHTQIENGFRDKKGKPRFARVPIGKETCPFCIMLASRGYVYHSEKTAGKLDHFHPKCDCRIVPSFDGGTVTGYDPGAYYEQYLQLRAEGKLNV